jgi:hypothetical protein
MEDHPPMFILLGTTPYLPLYWVSRHNWDRIVCRLVSPEKLDHSQRLLDVHLARQTLPCMMKDPLGQRWWHFDAYLTEVKVYASEVEATFVPTGEIRSTDASWYAPRPPRQQRRDAGQPRQRTAAPVAT